ncbi:unnamed protein product [Sphagnum balticum]
MQRNPQWRSNVPTWHIAVRAGGQWQNIDRTVCRQSMHMSCQWRSRFFNTNAAHLMYGGGKLMRDIFAHARTGPPVIIFIDEVCEVCILVSGNNLQVDLLWSMHTDVAQHVRTELLAGLDTLATAPQKRVLVVAATNRCELCVCK